jgi:hypothetical protein
MSPAASAEAIPTFQTLKDGSPPTPVDPRDSRERRRSPENSKGQSRMHSQPNPRYAARTGIVGALLAVLFLAANTAQAASNPTLDALLSLRNMGARAAPTAAAQVLPAPTRKGNPFRQTVIGDCRFNSPSPNIEYTFCRFQPVVVALTRLLEIQNISCFALPGQPLFLLAKSGNIAELLNSIVGVAPGTVPISANADGPYYFGPGERMFIWGLAEPGATAVCTVYGVLSPVD